MCQPPTGGSALTLVSLPRRPIDTFCSQQKRIEIDEPATFKRTLIKASLKKGLEHHLRMECFEKSPLHLTRQIRVGVSWLTSSLKTRKLRKPSVSELGKRGVLRGTRMRPNTMCKSMLDITRTMSDPFLVELTRTRMKEKSSEKDSSRAEYTQHLIETSHLVTAMMSQVTWGKCKEIPRRPCNGMKVIGDKKVLQQPRTHMVLWTTGTYGRQKIKMKLDTHIIHSFSEELRRGQYIAPGDSVRYNTIPWADSPLRELVLCSVPHGAPSDQLITFFVYLSLVSLAQSHCSRPLLLATFLIRHVNLGSLSRKLSPTSPTSRGRSPVRTCLSHLASISAFAFCLKTLDTLETLYCLDLSVAS